MQVHEVFPSGDEDLTALRDQLAGPLQGLQDENDSLWKHHNGLWDRQEQMWDREVKRWDQERQKWDMREQALQQRIQSLEAILCLPSTSWIAISVCSTQKMQLHTLMQHDLPEGGATCITH